jgi:hypothetical protein
MNARLGDQAASPPPALNPTMPPMRPLLAWTLVLLLTACAAPGPYVGPGAVGKAPSEVAKLLAVSEARLFPCRFLRFAAQGAPQIEVEGLRTDITLAPGRYVVTLDCASSYHSFKPQVDLMLRAGRAYRLTAFLVDDSITIFTMRMRVKVEEFSP